WPTRTYRPSRAPPIRTLTVGPGVPPGQPADGLGRVADCHRRFGIAPTPEHAGCVAGLACCWSGWSGLLLVLRCRGCCGRATERSRSGPPHSFSLLPV